MRLEHQDSLRALVDFMREAEAGVLQITPRRHNKRLFTVLIVDEPDEQIMADLAALQEKWDEEGDPSGAARP